MLKISLLFKKCKTSRANNSRILRIKTTKFPGYCRKWTVASYASFNKFYGTMSVGFCLNTEKRFLLEVLF